jgi:uncharacterized protein YndB with AHSA1/START domain
MTETHDVVVTRALGAPPEQVWKAWTEPGYVLRWWGPTGFTACRADMDVREGGTSLVGMRAPAEYGGFEMYNTWTYRRVDPTGRLEFDLRFTDADGNPADRPPGVPDVVPHVVTLDGLDGGRTALTVHESGYASAEARDLSAAGLHQCLDKMAAIWPD